MHQHGPAPDAVPSGHVGQAAAPLRHDLSVRTLELLALLLRLDPAEVRQIRRTGRPRHRPRRHEGPSVDLG